MSEPAPPFRTRGATEVLLVAIAIVAVVALAVAATELLPDDVEELVYTTPLAIGVLIAGTGLVLWRISRRQRT